MVVKESHFGRFEQLLSSLFQSPCGEVVVKVLVLIQKDRSISLFQSPCGEVVVKGFLLEEMLMGRYKVSVPLRGSGRETFI